MLLNFFIFSTILLLLICLLFFIFLMGLSRRIDTLADVSRRISKGDFDVNIQAKRNDKLGEIEESFKKMANELQKITITKDFYRQKEEQIRTLINASPDIICLKDADGRWLEANDATINLFQLQNVNYRGKKDSELSQFTHPVYKDVFLAYEENDRKSFEKGKFFQNEETIPLPFGGNKIYDVIRMPIFHSDGTRKGLILTGRDITQRRKYGEKGLQSLTLRFIGDGIILVDKKGIIKIFNERAAEITGLKPKDALERPLGQVLKVTNEKNGFDAWYYVQKAINNPEVLRPLENFRLLSKDNSSRHISLKIFPIFDKNIKDYGAVLAFQDVTDRMISEADLLRGERLESLGLLARGVANDFNNILTSMLGNILLIQLYCNLDEKTLERLRYIEKGCLDAADITKSLLTFANGAPAKEVTSISLLLQETPAHALKDSKSKARFSLSDDLWNVEVDPTQIKHVFQNLIINADHAMPDGGNIWIEAENIEIVPDCALPLTEGKYVNIIIRDEGPAIPAHILPRIFDPYIIFKAKGRSLDLATSYSIIKKHNGYVEVQSPAGKGTFFSVYLPATGNNFSPSNQVT